MADIVITTTAPNVLVATTTTNIANTIQSSGASSVVSTTDNGTINTISTIQSYLVTGEEVDINAMITEFTEDHPLRDQFVASLGLNVVDGGTYF